LALEFVISYLAGQYFALGEQPTNSGTLAHIYKMKGFTNRLVAGLLVSVGAAEAQATNNTRGLHELFVRAGKLFFGTATDTNLFNDIPYLAIANNTNEFGLRVPENSQKWEPTEATENVFTFTNPDLVLKTSKANQQMLRCHTLTWHQQLPTFSKLTLHHHIRIAWGRVCVCDLLTERLIVTTTKWTPETLTAAIQAHISNVVGHFKGQCYSWDVVNEALNDNGTFRASVFFETLKTDFIPISFAAAAAADPGAKLYYNDFNLETSKAKADAAVGIVQLLQSQKVRIDGVGFQAHLNVGQTPTRAQLAATLSRFTALGLEVAYTELDIAQTKLPSTAATQHQQALDYVSVVGSCLDVAACVGIVVWEFTDKYSWIPSTFPGKGEACLFNQNFNKKEAYTSVSSLLAAATPVARPKNGTSTKGKGQGKGQGMDATAADAEATPTSLSALSSEPTKVTTSAASLSLQADRVVVSMMYLGLGLVALASLL
jgi:endo-1,4-beta-xylanase